MCDVHLKKRISISDRLDSFVHADFSTSSSVVEGQKIRLVL